MPGDTARRFSLLAVFLVVAAVIALFTLPINAAPRAQATLPNVRLSTDTTITVTVAITDGQVIVVPIDLNIVTQNLGGEANVAIIAGVEQQTGLFIGVVPGDAAAATVQLTDASGAVVATPTPTSASATSPASAPATVGGTHVANANSNLRAGPGTNFERIGRVPQGDTVIVVGQNDDGTWLQLDDGSWIAEFLLDPVEGATAPADNGEEDEGDANGSDSDESEADENEAEGNDTVGENADDADTAASATPTVVSNQAALAIYLVSIAEIGAGAGDAVNELQALTQNPQPLNPQWRNEVGTQLDALSTALDQYLALTPVPGYEDLHAEVTAVAVTCQDAVNYLVGGIDNPLNIDPGTATESVQTCAAQASDLSAYLETVQ